MHEALLPKVTDQLTIATVDQLSAKDAETVAFNLIAQQATVKEYGKILLWNKFNQNPDMLVNTLLARVIVGQFEPQWFINKPPEQIVVMSIENSGSYIAPAIVREIQRRTQKPTYPRIIRVRKIPEGNSTVKAMSKTQIREEVHPITAGNEPRYLTASIDEPNEFKQVNTVIIADDFKATGSTLEGSIKLAHNLFQGITNQPILYIPTAAIGKREQQSVQLPSKEHLITPVLTALDITFWWDDKQEKAFIQANGFSPQRLQRVTKKQFYE